MNRRSITVDSRTVTASAHVRCGRPTSGFWLSQRVTVVFGRSATTRGVTVCRSIAEGARRCPGCGSPEGRRLKNIRLRIVRNERAAAAANAEQDWDRVERYADMLDRDLALHEEATRPAPPPAPPSRVAEFSADRVAHLSDDELVQAAAECSTDPAALSAIVDRLEERETAAQQEAVRAAERAAADQWQSAREDDSAVLNPVRRIGRRLTPEQQCRESYDSYVYDSWARAEDECRGVLLTKEAARRGVDEVSLFSGPAHVAEANASTELLQWWKANGRCTYREWKAHWFGRPSDRRAVRAGRSRTMKEEAA